MLLYIVLFLHQTTTYSYRWLSWCMLYIVLFLHQTTTSLVTRSNPRSCISYYSYIKPQLACRDMAGGRVVYRTIPTSNHNRWFSLDVVLALYIVLFLHQTTTKCVTTSISIKLYIVLFLHQTTTCKRYY
mgnify:CR=1 FL=1